MNITTLPAPIPQAQTLSRLLGLSAAGPLPLIEAVEGGLSLTALDRVAHSLAPADGAFVYRLVSRPTLMRRRRARATTKGAAAARLSASEGARLARLAAVWALALEVWGREDDARRFMFEAHPMLEGRAPVDLVLESELGRPVVEGILGRLMYGSAA
jgi:putative toxin-antitoxin system antitoxin component (TIGR02293 family)